MVYGPLVFVFFVVDQHFPEQLNGRRPAGQEGRVDRAVHERCLVLLAMLFSGRAVSAWRTGRHQRVDQADDGFLIPFWECRDHLESLPHAARFRVGVDDVPI